MKNIKYGIAAVALTGVLAACGGGDKQNNYIAFTLDGEKTRFDGLSLSTEGHYGDGYMPHIRKLDISFYSAEESEVNLIPVDERPEFVEEGSLKPAWLSLDVITSEFETTNDIITNDQDLESIVITLQLEDGSYLLLYRGECEGVGICDLSTYREIETFSVHRKSPIVSLNEVERMWQVDQEKFADLSVDVTFYDSKGTLRSLSIETQINDDLTDPDFYYGRIWDRREAEEEAEGGNDALSSTCDARASMGVCVEYTYSSESIMQQNMAACGFGATTGRNCSSGAQTICSLPASTSGIERSITHAWDHPNLKPASQRESECLANGGKLL